MQYLVKCGNFNQKQRDGIDHFLRASDMKKPVKLLNFTSIDQVVLPKDEKCVGFSFGKDCLLNDRDWLDDYRVLTS